jgi:hypothetical protein
LKLIPVTASSDPLLHYCIPHLPILSVPFNFRVISPPPPRLLGSYSYDSLFNNVKVLHLILKVRLHLYDNLGWLFIRMQCSRLHGTVTDPIHQDEVRFLWADGWFCENYYVRSDMKNLFFGSSFSSSSASPTHPSSFSPFSSSFSSSSCSSLSCTFISPLFLF